MSEGRVETNLSLGAPQAFPEYQLLLLLLLLQVSISFSVLLWFCIVQGTFWVTRERQQERESVQSSDRGCM